MCLYFKKLLDLNGGVVGENLTITCDASGAGWGEAKFDVVLHGRSLPHDVHQVDQGTYLVSFTPQERGKHRIYVYYNGIEVKGTAKFPINGLKCTHLNT